jgi:hypothetical protein
MSTALAIYGQFDQIQRAALALQKSGYFTDVKSEAQAIVKVMAGAELGLPPFASMSGIHIIQGKPVLGANVLATLVKNDPRYDYHVKQCDDKVCTLVWLENGTTVGESTFTMTEASGAGLTGKDNWKKYPSDMLFARAISRGARRFAPGIFGGSPVYTPDEMGADVDPEGYIDAQLVEVTQPEPEPEPEPAAVIEYPPHLATILNSQGVRYVDMGNDQLGYMVASIRKSMPQADDEKQAQYSLKLDAIKEIQAIRASK